MQQINAAVALTAFAVVTLGLVSRRAETTPLSRPMIALGFGVLVGPLALGWLVPGEWPKSETILKEAARFALAISVTGIAIRTPVSDYRSFAGPWAVLLTLGMVAMWAVSAGLGLAVLGLSPLVALALGACVTPTDPVVSSSIVTGTAAGCALPARTRSSLSLESGANDGLGYLIVLLPVTFLLHPDAGWERFFRDVLFVGVILAAGLGGLIGGATGWLLRLSNRHGWVEEHSLLGATVAMSLLALTSAKLLGSDGILAAFTAGMAFNLAVDRKEDFKDQNVQETISKLFNLPVLVVFGAMLPVSAWVGMGWGGAGFALAVLLLRRPLAVLVSWRLLGGGLEPRDKLFLGWFGPIGVAAIYYALHVLEKTGTAGVWHATSLVVTLSVLAHGLTSGPGLRAYARASRDFG